MTTNIKEYHKRYYSRPDIKEKHSEYMKEYYRKNRDTLLNKQKEYNKQNKDVINKYMRNYMRNYKSDKVVDKKSQLVDISEQDKVESVTDKD
jgi:hypothetical protein